MECGRKAFNVGVEYEAVPVVVKGQHPLDRLMTVAFGAKPEGGFLKERLEERFQQPSQDFLAHAVADDGDPERPGLLRVRPLGEMDLA